MQDGRKRTRLFEQPGVWLKRILSTRKSTNAPVCRKQALSQQYVLTCLDLVASPGQHLILAFQASKGNGSCFKVVSRLADHGIVRRDGGDGFRLTTLGEAVIRKVSKRDKSRPRSLPKEDEKSIVISIDDDDDNDGDEPELNLSSSKLPSFSDQLDWATRESLSVATLESSQIEQAKRRSLSDGGNGLVFGGGSGQM